MPLIFHLAIMGVPHLWQVWNNFNQEFIQSSQFLQILQPACQAQTFTQISVTKGVKVNHRDERCIQVGIDSR
jgi:hypothetical protein